MEWLISIADPLVTISLLDSLGVVHRASQVTLSYGIGHEDDHTHHPLETADYEVTSKFLVKAVFYVDMSLSYGGATKDNDDEELADTLRLLLLTMTTQQQQGNHGQQQHQQANSPVGMLDTDADHHF